MSTRHWLAAGVLLGLGVSLLPAASRGDDTATGRDLFLRKDKGYCVSCHQVPSDPGITGKATMGPPLAGVHARYPDRAALRLMLFDPTRRNPASVMPPYGRHQILGSAEIERIIDFLDAIP
jgi:sulfur-oxidizing protein SoxX